MRACFRHRRVARTLLAPPPLLLCPRPTAFVHFSVTFVACGDLCLACMRPTSGPKRGALQCCLIGREGQLLSVVCCLLSVYVSLLIADAAALQRGKEGTASTRLLLESQPPSESRRSLAERASLGAAVIDSQHGAQKQQWRVTCDLDLE